MSEHFDQREEEVEAATGKAGNGEEIPEEGRDDSVHDRAEQVMEERADFEPKQEFRN